MDAITLIREDHREVEKLFKKYEGLSSRAHKTKAHTVERLTELLSVHAAVEEMILYPALREWVDDMDDPVFEALEEHLVVKWELASLDDMDPSDERFDAKVMVLMEMTRHHVKEEEKEILPKLRQALSPAERRELGDRMVEAKKTAPTRPHPRLPDQPPFQAVAGMAAAVVDRARDLGEETVDQVRERVRS